MPVQLLRRLQCLTSSAQVFPSAKRDARDTTAGRQWYVHGTPPEPTPGPRAVSRQLSVIRGLDNHFDYLAGELFETDFRVCRACLIPCGVVKLLAK
jgi:hypothetical protein